ncbi:MAG: NAD(P)-binding domain-containing protein [Ferruginibacter sp.]
MKIGIIGSGIVGQVLGSAFLKEGYEVMLGSRNPQKEEVTKWKNKNSAGLSGNFADTAAFGKMLVLACAGSAAIDVISLAGKENFSGKIIIDATNPIAADAPVNGVLKFFTDGNESLMEKLQKELPEAKFVKAFNSVGNTLMYRPDYNGVKPTMFICGNDIPAKTAVSVILQKFGWETADMGADTAARAIEPLCILWCIPGFIRNEWGHAFKLLRK